MKRSRNARAGGALLAALLAAAGCGPGDASAAAQAAAGTPRAVAGGAPASGSPDRVVALGRIQPKDGVLHVAAPQYTTFTPVVGRLLVDRGDVVKEGQLLAELDHLPVAEAAVKQAEGTVAVREAAVRELEARLAHARAEARRQEAMRTDGVVSAADEEVAATDLASLERAIDRSRRELDLSRADLSRARIEADRALVRSPVAGRVLDVHARAGEKVGSEGILELARSGPMYVVAEVYETDIPKVRPGQRARVTTPLVPSPFEGTVERVAGKVGKKDVLGTDPAARTDVRVVEVEIRLDDGAPVSSLTNLTVHVEILPG